MVDNACLIGEGFGQLHRKNLSTYRADILGSPQSMLMGLVLKIYLTFEQSDPRLLTKIKFKVGAFVCEDVILARSTEVKSKGPLLFAVQWKPIVLFYHSETNIVFYSKLKIYNKIPSAVNLLPPPSSALPKCHNEV